MLVSCWGQGKSHRQWRYNPTRARWETCTKWHIQPQTGESKCEPYEFSGTLHRTLSQGPILFAAFLARSDTCTRDSKAFSSHRLCFRMCLLLFLCWLQLIVITLIINLVGTQEFVRRKEQITVSTPLDSWWLKSRKGAGRGGECYLTSHP